MGKDKDLQTTYIVEERQNTHETTEFSINLLNAKYILKQNQRKMYKSLQSTKIHQRQS